MPTALSVSPVPKACACRPFLRPSWAFFRCSQRVPVIASQVVFSEYGAAFGGEIASLRAGREVGRPRVARQGSVRRFVATVLPFQSAKPPATLRHVCPGARSTASKVNPETNLLCPAEHVVSGQFPRGGPLDWSGRKFSSSIIRIGLEAWHCEPADTFRGGYSRRGRCRLSNPSRHQNSLETRQPRAQATRPQTYPQKLLELHRATRAGTSRPAPLTPTAPSTPIYPVRGSIFADGTDGEGRSWVLGLG